MSEKRFECKINDCKYSTDKADTFKKHKQRTHKGYSEAYFADKQARANFQCQHCAQKFTQKNNMYVHVANACKKAPSKEDRITKVTNSNYKQVNLLKQKGSTKEEEVKSCSSSQNQRTTDAETAAQQEKERLAAISANVRVQLKETSETFSVNNYFHTADYQRGLQSSLADIRTEKEHEEFNGPRRSTAEHQNLLRASKFKINQRDEIHNETDFAIAIQQNMPSLNESLSPQQPQKKTTKSKAKLSSSAKSKKLKKIIECSGNQAPEVQQPSTAEVEQSLTQMTKYDDTIILTDSSQALMQNEAAHEQAIPESMLHLLHIAQDNGSVESEQIQQMELSQSPEAAVVPVEEPMGDAVEMDISLGSQKEAISKPICAAPQPSAFLLPDEFFRSKLSGDQYVSMEKEQSIFSLGVPSKQGLNKNRSIASSNFKVQIPPSIINQTDTSKQIGLFSSRVNHLTVMRADCQQYHQPMPTGDDFMKPLPLNKENLRQVNEPLTISFCSPSKFGNSQSQDSVKTDDLLDEYSSQVPTKVQKKLRYKLQRKNQLIAQLEQQQVKMEVDIATQAETVRQSSQVSVSRNNTVTDTQELFGIDEDWTQIENVSNTFDFNEKIESVSVNKLPKDLNVSCKLCYKPNYYVCENLRCTHHGCKVLREIHQKHASVNEKNTRSAVMYWPHHGAKICNDIHGRRISQNPPSRQKQILHGMQKSRSQKPVTNIRASTIADEMVRDFYQMKRHEAITLHCLFWPKRMEEHWSEAIIEGYRYVAYGHISLGRKSMYFTAAEKEQMKKEIHERLQKMPAIDPLPPMKKEHLSYKESTLRFIANQFSFKQLQSDGITSKRFFFQDTQLSIDIVSQLLVSHSFAKRFGLDGEYLKLTPAFVKRHLREYTYKGTSSALLRTFCLFPNQAYAGEYHKKQAISSHPKHQGLCMMILNADHKIWTSCKWINYGPGMQVPMKAINHKQLLKKQQPPKISPAKSVKAFTLDAFSEYEAFLNKCRQQVFEKQLKTNKTDLVEKTIQHNIELARDQFNSLSLYGRPLTFNTKEQEIRQKVRATVELIPLTVMPTTLMTAARKNCINQMVDDIAFGRQLLKESHNDLSKTVLHQFKHSDKIIREAFGAIADAFKTPYKELKAILKDFAENFHTKALDLYLEDCIDLADTLTQSEKERLESQGFDLEEDNVRKIRLDISSCLTKTVKSRVPLKSQLFTYRFLKPSSKSLQIAKPGKSPLMSAIRKLKGVFAQIHTVSKKLQEITQSIDCYYKHINERNSKVEQLKCDPAFAHLFAHYAFSLLERINELTKEHLHRQRSLSMSNQQLDRSRQEQLGSVSVDYKEKLLKPMRRCSDWINALRIGCEPLLEILSPETKVNVTIQPLWTVAKHTFDKGIKKMVSDSRELSDSIQLCNRNLVERGKEEYILANPRLDTLNQPVFFVTIGTKLIPKGLLPRLGTHDPYFRTPSLLYKIETWLHSKLDKYIEEANNVLLARAESVYNHRQQVVTPLEGSPLLIERGLIQCYQQVRQQQQQQQQQEPRNTDNIAGGQTARQQHNGADDNMDENNPDAGANNNDNGRDNGDGSDNNGTRIPRMDDDDRHAYCYKCRSFATVQSLKFYNELLVESTDELVKFVIQHGNNLDLVEKGLCEPCHEQVTLMMKQFDYELQRSLSKQQAKALTDESIVIAKKGFHGESIDVKAVVEMLISDIPDPNLRRKYTLVKWVKLLNCESTSQVLIDRAWNLLHQEEKAFIIGLKEKIFAQCFNVALEEYEQKVLHKHFIPGRDEVPQYYAIKREPIKEADVRQKELLESLDIMQNIPTVCILKDTVGKIPRNIRIDELDTWYQAYRNYLELTLKPSTTYAKMRQQAFSSFKRFCFEEFYSEEHDTDILNSYLQLNTTNKEEALIQHELCEICKHRYKRGTFAISLEFLPFRCIPHRYQQYAAVCKVDNFVQMMTCIECRVHNEVEVHVKRQTLFHAGHYDWVYKQREKEGRLKKKYIQQFEQAWRFHPFVPMRGHIVRQRELTLAFPVYAHYEVEMTYKKRGYNIRTIVVPKNNLIDDETKEACEYTLNLIERIQPSQRQNKEQWYRDEIMLTKIRKLLEFNGVKTEQAVQPKSTFLEKINKSTAAVKENNMPLKAPTMADVQERRLSDCGDVDMLDDKSHSEESSSSSESDSDSSSGFDSNESQPQPAKVVAMQQTPLKPKTPTLESLLSSGKPTPVSKKNDMGSPDVPPRQKVDIKTYVDIKKHMLEETIELLRKQEAIRLKQERKSGVDQSKPLYKSRQKRPVTKPRVVSKITTSQLLSSNATKRTKRDLKADITNNQKLDKFFTQCPKQTPPMSQQSVVRTQLDVPESCTPLQLTQQSDFELLHSVASQSQTHSLKERAVSQALLENTTMTQQQISKEERHSYIQQVSQINNSVIEIAGDEKEETVREKLKVESSSSIKQMPPEALGPWDSGWKRASSITDCDLATLQPGKWVEGSVITRYSRIVNHWALNHSDKKIFAFTAYMFKNILEQGKMSESAQAEVKQAMMLTKSQRFNEIDILLVPIIDNARRHWLLAVLDQRAHVLYIVNSGRTTEDTNGRPADPLVDYAKPLLDFFGYTYPSYFRICYEIRQIFVEQQQNQFDCGVFVILFMSAVACKGSIEILKSDSMKRINSIPESLKRTIITDEMMNGRLINVEGYIKIYVCSALEFIRSGGSPQPNKQQEIHYQQKCRQVTCKRKSLYGNQDNNNQTIEGSPNKRKKFQ